MLSISLHPFISCTDNVLKGNASHVIIFTLHLLSGICRLVGAAVLLRWRSPSLLFFFELIQAGIDCFNPRPDNLRPRFPCNLTAGIEFFQFFFRHFCFNPLMPWVVGKRPACAWTQMITSLFVRMISILWYGPKVKHNAEKCLAGPVPHDGASAGLSGPVQGVLSAK